MLQSIPHPLARLTARPSLSELEIAGDLTANNILLVKAEAGSGRPFAAKVSDFGLSRIHASESAIDTESFGTVRALRWV